MAGRIKAQSVDEVKARTRIEDVVGEYVLLKTAGVGSLKGLCPFHDEKTPSFNVRPHVGSFHCFGCGESGDAIAFVEKIEHLTFVEAVEFLARKAGVQLQYDDVPSGQRSERVGDVKRARLIDAHRVAEDFYMSQLSTSEAADARELLEGRGFDRETIAHFRIGYSPKSWSSLLEVLRKHGFTEKEISASGLAAAGSRGLYDRFRGRLMWPIHSVTGEPIGFGARKIDDTEEGPKYLNTPETMIYKKSQVLYGLDMAKSAMARDRKVVVVEGYTDVMAAHLAGVPYAVATCGTAFGHEHARIVRRFIGDTGSVAAGVILHTGRGFGGEVVFTFDGDAAGQKAALKVFQEDQTFGAQTFVSILPEGLDPCEMRIKYGDDAVREAINRREPLFAFVIRSVLGQVSLNTAEGRAAGLRATAPIVASIRDRVVRGEYIRQLSGWLGMDEHVVRAAVVQAERQHAQLPAELTQYAHSASSDGAGNAPEGDEHTAGARESGYGSEGDSLHTPVLKDRSTIRDPIERTERAALGVMIQLPRVAMTANADQLPAGSFVVPIHCTIFNAIRAAGGVLAADSDMARLIADGVDEVQAELRANAGFIERVAEQLDASVRGAVYQLSVEPLEEDNPENMQRYVYGVMKALIRQGYTRQIADVRSAMLRAGAGSPEHAALYERLIELENRRRIFAEADKD